MVLVISPGPSGLDPIRPTDEATVVNDIACFHETRPMCQARNQLGAGQAGPLGNLAKRPCTAQRTPVVYIRQRRMP